MPALYSWRFLVQVKLESGGKIDLEVDYGHATPLSDQDERFIEGLVATMRSYGKDRLPARDEHGRFLPKTES